MGPATVKMVDGGFSDRQGGEAEGADTLLKLIDKPALLFPCDAVPGKVLTGIVQRGHTVGSLLHKVKSYWMGPSNPFEIKGVVWKTKGYANFEATVLGGGTGDGSLRVPYRLKPYTLPQYPIPQLVQN